jgi:CubicO group peptidase (beta-lactamase class C family)
MVIAIVHDSDIVLAKGYGYADVEQRIPFDPDSTVIRIASVSKLFTGTAVLQVVERRLVDMHQDINTYLTRFKIEHWPGRPITLHHLLTHTAGFDDRSIGKSAWTQESQIPLGEFLATRLPRTICPPGEVYMYSNVSNALAGFVVEEVTHEDYASYVRHNILEPLGMGRSDYRLRPDLQPLLAQCYSHEDEVSSQPFDFINDYRRTGLSTGKTWRFMISLQPDDMQEADTERESAGYAHSQFAPCRIGTPSGTVLESFQPSQTVLMHDGMQVGSRLCLLLKANQFHCGVQRWMVTDR